MERGEAEKGRLLITGSVGDFNFLTSTTSLSLFGFFDINKKPSSNTGFSVLFCGRVLNSSSDFPPSSLNLHFGYNDVALDFPPTRL